MASLILTIVVLGAFVLVIVAVRKIVHDVEDRWREVRERRADRLRHRAEVLDRMKGMSHSEMMQAAARGEISMDDVLDHLVGRLDRRT